MADLERLSTIRPPSRLGTITSRIGSYDEAVGTAVVLQDMHANAGVQRNIEELIAFYVTQFDIPFCYSEGAVGFGDFHEFEPLPDNVRDAFCERLLQTGYITGLELFAVKHPEIRCDTFGIDDTGFYLIQSYAASLMQISERELVGVSKRAYRSFMQEIPRLPPDLRTIVSKVDELVALNSLSAQAVDPSPIVHIAERYDVSTAPIADLNRAVRDNGLQDVEAWIRFAFSVEMAVAEACELVSVALLQQFLVLCEGAFSTRLVSDMQPLVTDVAKAIVDKRMEKAAASLTSAWSLDEAWLTDVRKLTAAWSLPNTYYQYAVLRGKAMASNIARSMNEKGVSACTIFSGGFHSNLIARSLWDNHRINAIIVTPRVMNLSDGMPYDLRMLTENAGWTSRRAILTLLPRWVLQYGPSAVARKLFAIYWAKLREKWITQREMRAVQQTAPQRLLLLQEAVCNLTGETVLLVETGDLPVFLGRVNGRTIVADLFAHHITYAEFDMPGERWTWPRGEISKSLTAPVCCTRDYVPIRSGTIDVVVWIPRHVRIRSTEIWRAIGAMLRVLKPGGRLVLFLDFPGRDTTAFSQAALELGDDVQGQNGRWVISRKRSSETRNDAPKLLTMERPVVTALYLRGTYTTLIDRFARFLEEDLAGICTKRSISGLHEDLGDGKLGLTRPTFAEIAKLLQDDLTIASRASNLIVLLVTSRLLELVEGEPGLKKLLSTAVDSVQKLFIVLESKEEVNLSADYYACSDILEVVEAGGLELVDKLTLAIERCRKPGFRPQMPTFLPEYLACAECWDHPPLFLQIGFQPPSNSEGMLACKKCRKGTLIRNGIPVATANASV